MRVIGKPELLLPIGTVAGTRASSAANSCRFSSKSSATVSITQVTPAHSFQLSIRPMLAATASRAAPAASAAAVFAAAASVASARPISRPRNTTGMPASMNPAPMPTAIVPVPITTIFSTMRFSRLN